MANRWWSSVNSERLYFLCSKITANGDYNHEIKRHLLLGRKAMTNLDSILKGRDITLPTKVRLVKIFPVVVYECESWSVKKAEYQKTVVLEKTLESPLGCKEIQSIHPKGNQSWMLIGRTEAEAETPILWPPDAKNWVIGKDPDAGKDGRQKEKWAAENEVVRQHHWLKDHESEQTLEDRGGQRSLVCCSHWGCKELDTI